MLINLRNALVAGKSLPYDAEVEYLESTGTQYIDTGVIPNGVKSTIDFALTQVKVGQIAGCHNPNNQRYYPLEVYNNKFRRVDRNDSVVTFLGDADTNRHTNIYYYDGDKASFDGAESQSGNYAISSAIYNCILFGITVGGVFNADNAIPMKIFAFKMEKDGVVLRDFIPVRKGTVGYLYDRVTGKLFGNAGTGDFVVGPDVSASGRGGYKRKCVRRSYRRSLRPSYPPLAGGRKPWGRDQAERSEGRARFRLPSVALAKDGWRRTPLWKEVA